MVKAAIGAFSDYSCVCYVSGSDKELPAGNTKLTPGGLPRVFLVMVEKGR